MGPFSRRRTIAIELGNPPRLDGQRGLVRQGQETPTQAAEGRAIKDNKSSVHAPYITAAGLLLSGAKVLSEGPNVLPKKK